MFISKEQAAALTGYDVSAELLNMSQGIIESYVGRSEAEVDDARDLSNLGKATAYQAAYMRDNPELVFEQMAVNQIGQFGQIMSFRYGDTVSPFIAPLAVISCRNLSWRRARAIKTGRIHGAPVSDVRWETE